MNTLWTAAPFARVCADGVARARPADDDPLSRSDVSTTASTSASTTVSTTAPTGGEEDDTVGELRVRVGRIDAWREQGFASAREQRDHHRSDLFRYNQRRARAGRAPVSESEFRAMLEGGDEVSSISGSDDSDDDSDSDSDDDSNAATKHLKALHGKAEGAQIVCVGDDGVPFGVWRCLLRPDAMKAADAQDRERRAGALRALNRTVSTMGGASGWRRALRARLDPRKLEGPGGRATTEGREGARGGPLALVRHVSSRAGRSSVRRPLAGGRQA